MDDDEIDRRVTPVQIARMGLRADRAGQLELAAFLYGLAVDHDEHWPFEGHIPKVEVNQDTTVEGRKIARRTTPDER